MPADTGSVVCLIQYHNCKRVVWKYDIPNIHSGMIKNWFKDNMKSYILSLLFM